MSAVAAAPQLLVVLINDWLGPEAAVVD